MRRLGGVLTVLLLAALAVGFLVERHRRHRAEAERRHAELQAGVDASRVLSATFGRAASLRVATLTGQVMSRGACTSGYLFAGEQRTAAPYRVDYAVDLSGVGRAAYRWDVRDRVMFVTLPDVTAEPPAIDMAQARSEQTGLFVSRACGLALEKQVAARLAGAARVRSLRPDTMADAREAARAAVEGLVRAPLAAAGVTGVTVRVRFPFDARPKDDRQWDVSRSIDDVLSDPRYAP